MIWVVIIFSLVVIWVASVCMVFYGPMPISKTAISDDGKHMEAVFSGRKLQKKNALLVIAHPDAESMFFSPTMNYLTSKAFNLHILCLSTGNADGMGNIRKDELCRACAVLKVPFKQVKVLDHPNLQDGLFKFAVVIFWRESLKMKSLIMILARYDIVPLHIAAVYSYRRHATTLAFGHFIGFAFIELGICQLCNEHVPPQLMQLKHICFSV